MSARKRGEGGESDSSLGGDEERILNTLHSLLKTKKLNGLSKREANSELEKRELRIHKFQRFFNDFCKPTMVFFEKRLYSKSDLKCALRISVEHILVEYSRELYAKEADFNKHRRNEMKSLDPWMDLSIDTDILPKVKDCCDGTLLFSMLFDDSHQHTPKLRTPKTLTRVFDVQQSSLAEWMIQDCFLPCSILSSSFRIAITRDPRSQYRRRKHPCQFQWLRLEKRDGYEVGQYADDEGDGEKEEEHEQGEKVVRDADGRLHSEHDSLQRMNDSNVVSSDSDDEKAVIIDHLPGPTPGNLGPDRERPMSPSLSDRSSGVKSRQRKKKNKKDRILSGNLNNDDDDRPRRENPFDWGFPVGLMADMDVQPLSLDTVRSRPFNYPLEDPTSGIEGKERPLRAVRAHLTPGEKRRITKRKRADAMPKPVEPGSEESLGDSSSSEISSFYDTDDERDPKKRVDHRESGEVSDIESYLSSEDEQKRQFEECDAKVTANKADSMIDDSKMDDDNDNIDDEQCSIAGSMGKSPKPLSRMKRRVPKVLPSDLIRRTEKRELLSHDDWAVIIGSVSLDTLKQCNPMIHSDPDLIEQFVSESLDQSFEKYDCNQPIDEYMCRRFIGKCEARQYLLASDILIDELTNNRFVVQMDTHEITSDIDDEYLVARNKPKEKQLVSSDKEEEKKIDIMVAPPPPSSKRFLGPVIDEYLVGYLLDCWKIKHQKYISLKQMFQENSQMSRAWREIGIDQCGFIHPRQWITLRFGMIVDVWDMMNEEECIDKNQLNSKDDYYYCSLFNIQCCVSLKQAFFFANDRHHKSPLLSHNIIKNDDQSNEMMNRLCEWSSFSVLRKPLSEWDNPSLGLGPVYSAESDAYSSGMIDHISNQDDTMIVVPSDLDLIRMWDSQTLNKYFQFRIEESEERMRSLIFDDNCVALMKAIMKDAQFSYADGMDFRQRFSMKDVRRVFDEDESVYYRRSLDTVTHLVLSVLFEPFIQAKDTLQPILDPTKGIADTSLIENSLLSWDIRHFPFPPRVRSKVDRYLDKL